MVIGLILVEALVGGAVASLIAHLIVGWNTRQFVAWWLALSLVVLIGLNGPIKLG